MHPETKPDIVCLPADVPSEPVPQTTIVTGGSNTVRLHCRRGVYYQEAPYSYFANTVAMIVGAVLVMATSWADKYVAAAGMVAIGMAGGIAPFFVLNGLQGTIVIDPQKRVIEFRHRDFRPRMPWSEVVALQICCHRDPLPAYYQLNLVRRIPTGRVERYCLQTHGEERHILALSNKWAEAFGFPVANQSDPDK